MTQGFSDQGYKNRYNLSLVCDRKKYILLYALQAVPSIMYNRFFRAIHYRVGQPIIKVAVVVNHSDVTLTPHDGRWR